MLLVSFCFAVVFIFDNSNTPMEDIVEGKVEVKEESERAILV